MQRLAECHGLALIIATILILILIVMVVLPAVRAGRNDITG